MAMMMGWKIYTYEMCFDEQGVGGGCYAAIMQWLEMHSYSQTVPSNDEI